MKLLPALFSAILAVSFSSLAAAQSANSTSPNNPAATPNVDKDRAGANAGTGATDDMSKKKSKSAKKTAKKSGKAKDRQSKAAGGSSSAGTSANGAGNSNTSSPSRNTGMPGSANQGSIHNDRPKK